MTSCPATAGGRRLALDAIRLRQNVREIDDAHVDTLAQSIALRGVLVPMIVRPTDADDMPCRMPGLVDHATASNDLRARCWLGSARPVSLDVTPRARPAVGSGVRHRVPRLVAVLATGALGVVWVGASAVDASARECGTTKVIDGPTLRVQVLRGSVSCRVARDVVRHHVFTPGDLPPAPNAWRCAESRSGIVTCVKGRQTVRGQPR